MHELPTIAAFFALMVAIAAIYLSDKRANESVSNLSTDLAKRISSATGELIKAVKPRVVHCSSIQDVTREAALLVVKARESYEASDETRRKAEIGEPLRGGDQIASEREGILVDTGSRNYENDQFITLYGAADLDHNIVEDPNNKSDRPYHVALDQAISRGMRVRRYLSLVDTRALLESRSKEALEKYLHWIESQVGMLTSSSRDYQIIDNKRAPAYGSGVATIITNAGILEIKGNGRSAIAIYDPQMAASIRLSMRQELDRAMPENRKIVDIARLEYVRKEVVSVLTTKTAAVGGEYA